MEKTTKPLAQLTIRPMTASGMFMARMEELIRPDYYEWTWARFPWSEPDGQRPVPWTARIDMILAEFEDNPEWGWLVAGYYAGINETENIPRAVWDNFAELNINVVESEAKWKTDNQVKLYEVPVYRLLSSGLTALIRRGMYERAWTLLKGCTTPLQLASSSDGGRSKRVVNKELRSTYDGWDEKATIGDFGFWHYEHDFDIGELLAIQCNKSDWKTWIVWNAQLRVGHIYGPKANMIADVFSAKQTDPWYCKMFTCGPDDTNFTYEEMITLLSQHI